MYKMNASLNKSVSVTTTSKPTMSRTFLLCVPVPFHLTESCVTVLLAPPQGDPRVWETGPSIPSLSGSISIGHNIDPPSPQMTIRE